MPKTKHRPQKQPEVGNEFCYFPFFQLLLQPTGMVTPCCWNQDTVVGSLPESTIPEIWNGELMRRLRREFLEGKPVLCAQQIRHIGCQRWSRRPDSGELELSEVQSGPPRRLDVRLNGKCNLRCVMCDVWNQPNGIYDLSDFWTSGPTMLFPFLKEIDVLGGEPFVQRDTFRLIDEVSRCNAGCSWAFSTNGSFRLNQAILGRLDKIDIRWLQISIDSLRPEIYSRIRIGGNFERVMDTVRTLAEYRDQRVRSGRPFRLLGTMCVQSINWQETAEFLEFAARHRMEPVLQFAYLPESVSLLGFSPEERLRVTRSFELLARQYDPELIQPILLPMQESLRGDGVTSGPRP